MSQQFLGEIRAFSYGFAPKTWAKCDGQLLGIAQNSALFSLLGTTYGGDGRVTFALPDLRGRAANGPGAGVAGGNFIQGQSGGAAEVTLIPSEMPIHNHLLTATSAGGDAPLPQPQAGGLSNYFAAANRIVSGQPDAVVNAYVPSGTMNMLSPGTVGNTGGSQPHDNMQPYLVINYCIALQGIFPSRN